LRSAMFNKTSPMKTSPMQGLTNSAAEVTTNYEIGYPFEIRSLLASSPQ
jgi:hypothetical protein